MGIYSEMNMEQFENDEMGPFQMDSHRPDAVEWHEQAGSRQQLPQAAAVPAGGSEAKPSGDGVVAAPQSNSREDAGKVDSEEAKRKAHEEAEAKRKAEWDAQQASKKAAEQEKLQQIAAMSDDEVMMASAKRVGTDTEKITRRNMKDCVSEVIQTKCLEDPAFARLVMQPRKNMINCFKYITRKAWEYVQDELKADGITPGNGAQGYGCDVPDDLCYQWAVDYFNDPDAKEDQKAEESLYRSPMSAQLPQSLPERSPPKTAPRKSRRKPSRSNHLPVIKSACSTWECWGRRHEKDQQDRLPPIFRAVGSPKSRLRAVSDQKNKICHSDHCEDRGTSPDTDTLFLHQGNCSG